ISDEFYELCLPILKDEALEDEEKTEKMEELLRKESHLTDKALENAILDGMWRFRSTKDGAASPPPSRHTIIRKSSPAPWQIARTPTPSAPSPRFPPPPPGFGVAPAAFARAKSSTASPFTSPRPSPRLAVATPHIPHSPSLNAYEFSGQPSPITDDYGDYGSDTVDWLVNDETASNASSSFMADGLNGAAAEYIPDQMSIYDMLRQILREERSDEELERVLEANSYDLSATVTALMEGPALDALLQAGPTPDAGQAYMVGKSMAAAFRPATPSGQGRTPVMCKYWLQNGHCARADCRFSHDPSKTVCKYWMAGNCLAGDTCLFSHDPSTLMARMMLEGAQTPPSQSVQPNFQVQDYENFPHLQRTTSGSSSQLYQGSMDQAPLEKLFGAGGHVSTPPPGLNPFSNFGSRPSSRAHSRPGSRPHSRQGNRSSTPSAPALDDAEAFPSLGSAAAKGGKKHHGKRGGHGHHRDHIQNNTLADVVRMSPSPSPAQARKGVRNSNRNSTGTRENSAAAMAVPQPEHIPWLETGDGVNKAYLKARQEAFRHGASRNKFLQSAAQAWNRNDTRAAKALSLRGQTENNLMKEAHREAARILYDERNKEHGPSARELYVDLHGLHPEEAIVYLSTKLLAHQNHPGRPIYAITGTGHHSKNGRDKVNKAVRAFLNEWRYAFREFSVPGDRNNVGGILGIDPTSWDRSLEAQGRG
ncbi:hypothetical protein NA57DRAFT_11343, partial [Rhizodiscina lignyota]